jgi:Zinc carboxypeptidase/Immune inhibitor A peptidase M6
MTSRRASLWLPRFPAFLVLGGLVAGALFSPASLEAASIPEREIYRVRLADVKDPGPLFRLGLDVAGSGPAGTVDLILTPSQVASVQALGFHPARISLGGTLLAPESPLLNPNLGNYHTYAEAHDEMVAYVGSHPTLALMDTIGFSLEGRPIEAVKISDHVALAEGEPQVLIVGCHHARELMSVELPLYVMRRLLDGYGVDPVITSLVDSREIWIVPIVNPDGYVYVQDHTSGQSDTWWRKNRRLNDDGTYGVDLNRNYSYHWGWDNVGSSPTPSSEVYRGTAPFSEPEVLAIRSFMAAHAFTISASFHSYGDLFLYPWGYDRLDTPDQVVFHAFGDSVSAQNGYLAGNPKSGAIYLTNGDMDDWEYGDTATKPQLYGFTFELNSAAEGGFAPADALIPTTCTLNWGPVLTLLRYADQPRRIVPPARPAMPWFVSGPGDSLDILWAYTTPDPRNPPVQHDLRRIATLTVGADDGEFGFGAWDTLGFTSSTARHRSGTRSFWSGSGNNRRSALTGRAGLEAAAGESLVTWAYWDLELDYDYWYAEASEDGGATWIRLAGDQTTNFNPFGGNEGNGITGTSGGLFKRAAFSLGAVTGRQPLVRFRYSTDPANFGEGLYLDDIAPTAVESGIADQGTGSATERTTVVPAPSAITWFQARGVDGEGQRGPWSPRARFEPGVTAIEVAAPELPAMDRLLPNVPNPFNPRTTIRFALGTGRPGPYSLEIADLFGRRVALLESGWDDGRGSARRTTWDGLDGRARDAASGVYFLKLHSVRGITSRKITLLR